MLTPSSPPPRYHASPQKADSLHPGTITARLAVLSPKLWKEIEAYLLSKGLTPY